MVKRKNRAMEMASIADRDRPGTETTTAERVAKAGAGAVEVTPPSQQAPKGTQRVLSAPLDRLWKDGAITQREYEAGDKFRADAYLAAIDPGSGTVDWHRAGGGGTSGRVPSMFTAQHIFDARIRWRSVEKAIPKHSIVASALHLGLVHEHSLEELGRSLFARNDKREAMVAGHAGFRVALGALADFYGM